MRVFRLTDLPTSHGQAIALGYFDGGHKGHAALLEKTVSEARTRGIESAVFSFSELPTKSGVPSRAKRIDLPFSKPQGSTT